MTFVSTPLEALAFQGASMRNRATLSLCYFLSLGVGMCLGPLLCSTLLEIYKASDASVSGQGVVSFVGDALVDLRPFADHVSPQSSRRRRERVEP